MEGTRPSGLALVLSDNIYADSRGKRALVGLFNRVMAIKFPATLRRMVVFVAVTDIRPKTQLKLDIVHGETEQVIFQASGPPPEEAAPTTIVEFVFEVENLVFPEAATYFVRFWGNEYVLLQRPIQVVLAGRQQAPDREEDRPGPAENEPQEGSGN